MPHVVYYAAVALDGRISGPEDDLAFLATLEGAGGSYEEFFAGVDSLVMGGHSGGSSSATARGRTATVLPGS